MRRRVAISVVLCFVLCGFSCAQGRFWKALGNLAGAVGGAVMDGYLQQSGYSANESREIISNVSSALGVNSSNVQKGIDFMDSDKKGQVNMAVDMAIETTGTLTGKENIASQVQKRVDAGFDVSNADDKYEKTNIITGTAMDVVGDLTGGHSVTDKISAYVGANMDYLSEVSKAETVRDLQIAEGKKKQAYTNLLVDIGMDLYDYREKQKNKPKWTPEPMGPAPYPYESNGGEIPIKPHENHLEPSRKEIGKKKEIVPNFVPSEEQEVPESSENMAILEAFNTNQKESKNYDNQEEKNVLLSDVPQELKPVIEVLKSEVSISKSSEGTINSKDGITKEDNKQEREYLTTLDIKPEENNVLEGIDVKEIVERWRSRKESKIDGLESTTYTPQESKPVIGVSEPSVSITQPVEMSMTFQESIKKEESKIDIEESPAHSFIVESSPKITDKPKPKKQKAEYLYDITNESSKFESSKPVEKNIMDALLVPIVKECGVGEYPFNSVELSEDSKKELDKLYDILIKNVDLHIKITGHTCNVGSEEANFRVGWERAKKWKDYLVENGIDKDRILLESKGEKQPIVSNTTSENREKNRRVEIDVLNPEEEEGIRMQVNRQVQLYAPRTFRVQIMATPKPIENYDSICIMGYDIYDPMEEEVGYVKGKTVYRYVSEEMRSRDDAKALRDYFVKRGFKDAWIVEYRGAARIPF